MRMIILAVVMAIVLPETAQCRNKNHHKRNCPSEWNGGCIGPCAKDTQFENMHLILSHCKHDLGWLPAYVDLTMFDTLTIVSKCGVAPQSAPENATRIQLPNVGRCDHTYAWWMMNAVDKLNDDDFVLFLKDTHSEEGKGKLRSFSSMLSVTKTNGFSCGIQPSDGHSVFHNLAALRRFRISEYGKMDKLFESKLNFEEWAQELELNVTGTIVPVCYNGVFSAIGKNIKKRAKVWLKLTKSLSRHHNLEEGHFTERTWASLLHNELTHSFHVYI